MRQLGWSGWKGRVLKEMTRKGGHFGINYKPDAMEIHMDGPN